MQPHRSSATLLFGLYVLVVVYASLYPFSDWRDQGLSALGYLWAPWPRYWNQFDTFANFLGYAPLGFLGCLALLRTTVLPQPVLLTAAFASALSMTLEASQTYLPTRVPAVSDWLLNSAGALTGAALASALERWGVINHWSRFRARWFEADARAPLVLLVTWPIALLFPAPVALGLGQVFERLETALTQALVDTPFLQWLPVREIELQPLVPLGEVICVALGLLAPCLLGMAVVRNWSRRAMLLIAVCALSVMATALSSALSYGPEHAWAWWSSAVATGWLLGLCAAVLCSGLARRACLTMLLVALVWQLSLINSVPSTPYFAQTLQSWEQGRFIRFHGLAQWLGWLWPYATVLLAALRLSQRETLRL